MCPTFLDDSVYRMLGDVFQLDMHEVVKRLEVMGVKAKSVQRYNNFISIACQLFLIYYIFFNNVNLLHSRLRIDL